MISLNFTHSHLKMFLPEQKFSVETNLTKVREIVANKFGTVANNILLKLKDNLIDISLILANSNLHNGDTIHIHDNNTQLYSFFADLNNIDESNVEKYNISDED
mmetsp:Transcript_32640/g.27574  ORF Transcript_32640/g.27574 Transcript_32640/m.27574 type:complete len:104 (+) Transcript_32640:2-313(+)